MATKLNWTAAAAKAANETHKYIRVGGKTPGTWLISGAVPRFENGEDVVYVYDPSMRVAGSRSAVKQLLQNMAAGTNTVLSEEQMEQLLAQRAYTLQNYKSLLPQIEREVAALKAYQDTHKVDVKDKTPTMTREQVQMILDSVKTVTPVPSTGKAVTGKTGRKGSRRSLHDLVVAVHRENLANPGDMHAYNVTTFKADGTGARKVPFKAGSKTLKMIEGLPLVINVTKPGALAAYNLAIDRLIAESGDQSLAGYKARMGSAMMGDTVFNLASGQGAAPTQNQATNFLSTLGTPQ